MRGLAAALLAGMLTAASAAATSATATSATATSAGDEGFLKGNGGFERGDLTGWRLVSGGGWEVADFDHPNKKGRYYATTCDSIWPGDGGCKNSRGERDTGDLFSDVFTVDGGFLEFRIAGYSGTRCGRSLNEVTLRRASDHEALRRAPVPCQNPFRPQSWDLAGLEGERVYIWVHDGDGRSGWAWIAVDDFRLAATRADRPRADEDLRLEPEAGQITFTSRRTGREAAYTMAADGSAVTPLTRVSWKIFHPAWSPDGQLLAAVSNRGSRGMDIYVMGILGLWQLTTHPASDHHPAWSPDGRQIAFVSDRSGAGDLYVIPSGGGRPERLTRDLAISEPAWSPSGERIAFSSGGDIVAVDLSGRLDTLAGTPDWEGYPAWSPDGGRLALVRDGELWVLDLATGATRQVTDSYTHASDPSWSPDQRYIAFASSREGNQEVYVAAVASGRLGRLTYEPADDFEPVWYPAARPLPLDMTAVAGPDGGNPDRPELLSNFPNPFNAATTIRYRVVRGARVQISVVDILGRRVATLASSYHPPGDYRLEWAARDGVGAALGSGVYVARLETDAGVLHRRMLLLR